MRFVCLLLSLCLPLMGQGKIVSLETIHSLEHYWKAGTWFLVDLDNCLFEGKQALGHADWFYDQISQEMIRGTAKKDALAKIYPQWVALQERCAVQPIEEGLVELIQHLQRNGITVIGLTHRQPSVKIATALQVRSLGILFERSGPDFDGRFTVNIEGPAVYHDGILFVGDYNAKSSVLSAFLAILNEKPKEVVFIDDKLSNVKDLEDYFRSLETPYLGIHYTAIQSKPKIYDPELAKKQLYYFDRILSNEEIRFMNQ